MTTRKKERKRREEEKVGREGEEDRNREKWRTTDLTRKPQKVDI